jgi:hypothetical protein
MSVEIWTETAQFPEKENIKGFSLQCTQYAALTLINAEDLFELSVNKY